MTIDETTAVFPNNIISLIKTRAAYIDPPTLYVATRPLRASDPSESFGVFAAQWEPNQNSYEIKGSSNPGPNEPTLQTYLIAIQAFVKDFQEDRGLAKHSVLSKYVRAMLYRDDPLRLGLAALSVSMNGSVERAKRWGIRTQRYLSNEIEGAFCTFPRWSSGSRLRLHRDGDTLTCHPPVTRSFRSSVRTSKA